MPYDGKRSDRLRIPTQVNDDPEMGAEIARRAERRHRSKGGQVIYLLRIGLQHDPEEAIHERLLEASHAYAQLHTDAHVGAPPHTAAHASARKNGTTGGNGG